MLTESRDAQDLLSLLVDTVDEYAIFLLDPYGRVATWNRGAERIKGYRAEEILGQHFEIFYPEADRATGKPAAELVTASESGVFREQGWRVRKDGSRFLADVVITRLLDPEGNLRGFAKVTRDETERARADAVRVELATLARRDRVSAELADTVVRHLFRAGLDLQATLGLPASREVSSRIEMAIDSLDAAIKEIRAVIVQL